MGLVKLGFLFLSLFDYGSDSVFKFTFEFLLNLSHLCLVRAHLFLVVLLMFTIVFDLLLDFLSDVLILLDFLGASIPQIVDLLRHLSHPLLEVFGQVGTQLPLLVEHRLVLQIQVVVLLED